MSEAEAVRLRPEGRNRTILAAPTQTPAPVSKRWRLFLILADAALAESFYLTSLALVAREGILYGEQGLPSGPLAVILGILYPVIVGSRGLYRLGRFPSWRGQAAAGLRAVAWSVGLSITALFLFAREIPWALRLILVIYHVLLAFWMVAVRPLLAVLVQRRAGLRLAAPERTLIVGAGAPAMEIARRLHQSPGHTEVLAFADVGGAPGTGGAPFLPLTDLDALPSLADEMGVQMVIVARPDLPREEVVRLSDQLIARGIRVRVAHNLFNKLVDTIPIESHGGVPLLPVAHSPLSGWSERWKRVFDFAAATIGGIAILPILLALALLVRLSSPGPVLYRQTRVGRNGRSFTFFKFRSMRVDNDDADHRRYLRDLMGNGHAAGTDGNGNKVYKLIDDSRVTPIGKFLRRTSLDELPQLINVLRGEMSLVGPRPCVPFEYELYRDWQKRRLSVTPGMTGLWQVTGRSYVNFEDQVLLDLFYIANWSFGMDLKLLLRTVPVVIWGKGGL